MKIHTFYKKPTNEDIMDNATPLDVKYPLYAITPSKKIAKLFKNTRDMNQFIYSVIDCEPDEGYDEYFIAHRGQLLQKSWLEGIRDKNKDTQEPYWVEVLLTENELNFTMEAVDSGLVLNRVSSYMPVPIFAGKYVDALQAIQYEKAALFALSMRGSDLIESVHPTEYDVLDLDMTFDMFAVFMLLYQKTLSPDFFTNITISDIQPEQPGVH